MTHLSNMMEQGKYAQDADILVSNDIMSCLIRNFMANPIKEEEKFVEKEEYLNQYRENNFWVMPQIRKATAFFNYISYRGVNEELKEKQKHAIHNIFNMMSYDANYRIFNDLHRSHCLQLEEKYVTTILQPNVVAIPI